MEEEYRARKKAEIAEWEAQRTADDVTKEKNEKAASKRAMKKAMQPRKRHDMAYKR